MAVHLPPFDPDRPLVAIKFFRFNGEIISRGQKIPRDFTDPRKLDQLYRTRHIGYEGESTVRPVGGRPLEPMTEDGKRPDGANAGILASTEATPTTETAALAEADAGGEGSAQDVAEKERLAEERDALIKKLVRDNTHDDLFKKASGLAGVTKDQKKVEIATALVDAGRAGDPDGSA